MAKFDSKLGLIELEVEDEPQFSLHFLNARAAWSAHGDLQDGRYLYHVGEKGVLGRLIDRVEWEYFWARDVLEEGI